MWCTQCKVAFDYVTLKIDTGNVHNPHYYEHLQNLNNGLTPRNPQDVLCGGLCNYTDITNILNHIWKTMMILSNDTDCGATAVAVVMVVTMSHRGPCPISSQHKIH